MMKYWYIEDAGGGCKAFSEVLVLVCENPRLIYKSFMPLTWNSGITMEEMACTKVREMMQQAGVSHDDYLYVCSGNIFYGLHKWLTENGYPWETTKMDGLAHEVAESSFNNQIFTAGFPSNVQLEERNYRDFYRMVDSWLKEDPARKRYVKDMEVRRKPEQFRYILKGNSGHTRRCSECRKKIYPYNPVVHYRYREYGKKKNRYYHPSCSPHEPHKNKLKQAIITWKGNELEGVILPNRKELTCAICDKEVSLGVQAFHALIDKELIFGHPECFEKPKKNLLNQD